MSAPNMENVEQVDVLVVGAGNAALSAALAAKEAGATSVKVIERAPEALRGGNSRFTGGMVRFAYDNVEQLREVATDMSDDEAANADFGTYTADQFSQDMERVTQYRADPDLAALLVDRSRETLAWQASHGVRFIAAYGHQAYKVDGRFVFWGGLTLQASGGGPGLVQAMVDAVEKQGISIQYATRGESLIEEDGVVRGVVTRQGGKRIPIRANAVVLASGGFQSNAEWRTRYLGPGWDLAKVRGTRYNTGDGIQMAMDAGAVPWGHWSGGHAVAWDRNAPDFGDLAVGDAFQKHSYPLGIMVNTTGQRFVDEGADFRNYTYAKYGHIVLEQPQQVAWQVFDGSVLELLRDEYRIRQATRVRANSIEELAAKMDDVNSEAFVQTVQEFNAAVQRDVTFNPAIKDGRGTPGLDVPKTNWAVALENPPYEAYQVTCGLTFTFGGLKITPQGQVINVDDEPMPGLYAAGEIVGGLFYFNYPGGSGLTSGAVFGRIAGTSAAMATAT